MSKKNSRDRVTYAQRAENARRVAAEATIADPSATPADVEAASAALRRSTPRELRDQVLKVGGPAMVSRVKEAIAVIAPPPGVRDYARGGTYFPSYLRRDDGSIVLDAAPPE